MSKSYKKKNTCDRNYLSRTTPKKPARAQNLRFDILGENFYSRWEPYNRFPTGG